MAKNISASDLGINLKTKKESELFKWFLACLLFGKPIQQAIAAAAYQHLKKNRITSPRTIIKAGWKKLVRILGDAHYVRYDESTATKLLEISKTFLAGPKTMTKLIKSSKSSRELSQKLQEFKGVGPVTARIFLREIRPLFFNKRP